MSRIGQIRSRVVVVSTALVSAAVLAVVPPGPSSAADGWGAVEDISVSTIDIYSDSRPPALVEVRADGTAVAAWVSGDDETPGPVVVSLRDAGVGWTAPQALSAALPEAARYDLAVGSTGLASVVWERRTGSTWRIEESHLSGGLWSATQRVATGRDPHVVVDASGVATVAWSNRGLRVARRSAGGSWSAARRIGDRTPWLVDLASNAQGDVAVAWSDRSHSVKAAVRPVGRKEFRRTQTLGKGPSVTSLRAAVDRRGRAVALWSVTGIWNESRHDYENYVAWARSSAEGQWSASRVLTRHLGEDGGAVDLSLNRRGAGVATWVQTYRSDSPTYLWAARLGRNGRWNKPARVSTKPVAWGEIHAWLDSGGTAHALAARAGSIREYSQRPGGGWTGTSVAAGTLLDADGLGHRCVLLFYRHGVLRSRAFDAP